MRAERMSILYTLVLALLAAGAPLSGAHAEVECRVQVRHSPTGKYYRGTAAGAEDTAKRDASARALAACGKAHAEGRCMEIAESALCKRTIPPPRGPPGRGYRHQDQPERWEKGRHSG